MWRILLREKGVLFHLPHARKYELYQEIYKLLSPNGIFINVEHVASQSKWGEMLSDELFIDYLTAFEEKQGSGKKRDQISRDFHNREDKKDNILISA